MSPGKYRNAARKVLGSAPRSLTLEIETQL